jgi:choice-of-anchor B domain-containing protein
MKNLFLLILIISSVTELRPQNVNLLGNLDPYPGKKYTDCWGYTDSNGREYALMGVEDGTTIIDITNPANPTEAAFIPGPLGPNYYWRDIKVQGHYAYIVSDNSGDSAGLQIVNLSQLPDTAFLVNNLQTYFTTAHNLYITDGYAYVVGTDGGGMHILDLSNPENPVQTAFYDSSGYIHDVYVWNDTAYVSSSDTYDLVDVTNKNNPGLISQSAALPGIYAHSGWLSEDKRYFIACEEFNKRDITIWDLQDRNNWDLVITQWQMPTDSRVHNVFVKGNFAHLAYYTDGYVVLDISNPLSPQLAGQFDTFPDGGIFAGAWGCYPYFNSGNIIISDISTGLYIVDFLGDNSTGINDLNKISSYNLLQNFPNPFNPSTDIKFEIPENTFVDLSVFSITGEKIAVLVNEVLSAGKFNVSFDGSGLASGIYFARLQTKGYSNFIKMILLK